MLHVSACLTGKCQVHKGEKITSRRSVAFTNIKYNNNVKIFINTMAKKQAETCCGNIVNFFFFLFNRHCNSCGFWPAQLSLCILSRKVFTECRCQRHVKPPTWRTSDQNFPPSATRCLQRLKRHERTPAAEGGTMVEKQPRNLLKVATSKSLLGSFTCRKFTTWFTSPTKEGALGIFTPLKSESFGRVLTRELGYQRPAHSPLDHRSRKYSEFVTSYQLCFFYTQKLNLIS